MYKILSSLMIYEITILTTTKIEYQNCFIKYSTTVVEFHFRLFKLTT